MVIYIPPPKQLQKTRLALTIAWDRTLTDVAEREEGTPIEQQMQRVADRAAMITSVVRRDNISG